MSGWGAWSLTLWLWGCSAHPPSQEYLHPRPIPLQLNLPHAPRYPLRARYRGEELIGVKYYQEQERAPYQVFVCGALLCDARGALLDPELDRPEHSKRSGKAIFVIDDIGQMWLTFDQRYGVIHHSSLVAGGDVIAAGELFVMSGRLLSISNESGHYHPPPVSVEVTLRGLRIMGVAVRRVERYIIRAGQTKARLQR